MINSGNLRFTVFCSIAVLGQWLGFPNDLMQIPGAVLLWPAGLILIGSDCKSGKRARKIKNYR